MVNKLVRQIIAVSDVTVSRWNIRFSELQIYVTIYKVKKNFRHLLPVFKLDLH